MGIYSSDEEGGEEEISESEKNEETEKSSPNLRYKLNKRGTRG